MQHAVGLTLSDAQAAHVQARKLPGVEVRTESWAKHQPAEPYDSIISIGAFEHFAPPSYPTEQKIEVYRDFFRRCRSWLTPKGRLSLQTIAYGETASYGEIALRLGMTNAASRAVGLANGRNPIPVVVPCHRVVGADGRLREDVRAVGAAAAGPARGGAGAGGRGAGGALRALPQAVLRRFLHGEDLPAAPDAAAHSRASGPPGRVRDNDHVHIHDQRSPKPRARARAHG